jgi:glucokinase
MIAAGIDIGGTKIAVGLVGRSGDILAQRSLATEAAAGFDRAVGRMIAAVDECLSEAKVFRQELSSIGIGCAGPVSPKLGTIDNPYTLPTWDGVDIVTPLGREFGVPVELENDADAAALGEAAVGAGEGRGRIVMLTYGTGIGSGVILNGKIYRGAADVHPELGHLPIDAAGPECYCGKRGCFEAIASGTALSAAGAAAGFGDARGVFVAAARGDRAAAAIVERAVAATFTAVWTIQHTFVPDRIILGGGIIDEHFELFAAAARRAVESATLNPKGATDVVQARLGNRAGIVGAAMLVGR